MAEKKNQVIVLIEDCRYCPNAILKFDHKSKEDIMYCQTQNSLIMLRNNGWGSCSIPNWCPRISRLENLCGKRVKNPGVLS